MTWTDYLSNRCLPRHSHLFCPPPTPSLPFLPTAPIPPAVLICDLAATPAPFPLAGIPLLELVYMRESSLSQEWKSGRGEEGKSGRVEARHWEEVFTSRTGEWVCTDMSD